MVSSPLSLGESPAVMTLRGWELFRLARDNVIVGRVFNPPFPILSRISGWKPDLQRDDKKSGHIA
jgi:hypothetical protein